MRNTQHTLWASWVVAGPEHRVYHSGDTGTSRLRRHRRRARPVRRDDGADRRVQRDVAGDPHDARGGLRAHRDLQGDDSGHGVMLPIHWGTFNLAPHPWDEPAEGRWKRAAPSARRSSRRAPASPSSRPPVCRTPRGGGRSRRGRSARRA
ncbi:hypothetical protein NKH77_42435 [Streptomyces sp. M19]